MCWSKYERERWERELRESQLDEEQVRLISSTEPPAEPEPAPHEEREPELVRG